MRISGSGNLLKFWLLLWNKLSSHLINTSWPSRLSRQKTIWTQKNTLKILMKVVKSQLLLKNSNRTYLEWDRRSNNWWTKFPNQWLLVCSKLTARTFVLCMPISTKISKTERSSSSLKKLGTRITTLQHASERSLRRFKKCQKLLMT